jgi:Glycosyltransferase family 92
MSKYYLSAYCRFRNEARWLPEWLEYHLLVGVEHFYLMDHLSTDYPQGALEPYIQRGQVTLLHWEEELPSPGSGQDHSQVFVTMGNSVLAQYRHETRWLAVIDSDEFLVPAPTLKLVQILAGFEQYPAVAVNWQLFGTSSVAKIPTDRLLLESLTMRAPRNYPDNQHVKVIIQPAFTTGLQIHNAHYAGDLSAVNTNGEQVVGPVNTPILTDKLRLHHYVLRDREFMLGVKVERRLQFGHDADILFQWEREMNVQRDLTMMIYVPELRKRLIPPPWQEYLKRNPDLVAAGITSKEGAELHWRNAGRYEERVGA